MNLNTEKIVILARELQAVAPTNFVPPSEGTKPQTNQVLPHSIIKDTRGYIERVCYQINGCYEKGWYDGCAVMMRRLLETLIIESFEFHNIDAKIKNTATGDFLYLKDLIDLALTEPTWNIGRNVKQALPKLKQLGDQSAHSRRYNAHREDIDKLSHDFRISCQELVYLARLK